jgi:hypothetical protein
MQRGALSVEKEDCLDEMGFTWDLSKTAQDSWDGKARQLMAFRMAHGHSSVPQCYEESPSLGRWVARMRHMNATGNICLDQRPKSLVRGRQLDCF